MNPTDVVPHSPIGKLVVIGVGLIGGSCALALREANAVREVVGVGRSERNLKAARELGIVDRSRGLSEGWTDELRNAEIVLLAAPVAQYPALFASMHDALGADTLVTDAGSTKQDVLSAARRHLAKHLRNFVPGHPIAGGEQSGAIAARADLFVDKITVLTPLPETSITARARVAQLWAACGARVVDLDAATHDRMLAAVSHLPHLIAFAYIAAVAGRPDAKETLALAGSGFRDFTRIAASSPEMWRDIGIANRDALLLELAGFRGRIEELEHLLRSGDVDALMRFIADAAGVRRAWGRVDGTGDDEA